MNEYHEDTWLGRNEDVIALLAIVSFLAVIIAIIVFVSRREGERDDLCRRSGGIVGKKCHTGYTQSCVPIQVGTMMIQQCSSTPYEACDHYCVGGGGEASSP